MDTVVKAGGPDRYLATKYNTEAWRLLLTFDILEALLLDFAGWLDSTFPADPSPGPEPLLN